MEKHHHWIKVYINISKCDDDDGYATINNHNNKIIRD